MCRDREALASAFHASGSYLVIGEEVAARPGFDVLNDVVFNQVLVACESDELTVATMQRIQERRECWVGGSTWHGRAAIRIGVSSWATMEQDITRSVDSFETALAPVIGEPA